MNVVGPYSRQDCWVLQAGVIEALLRLLLPSSASRGQASRGESSPCRGSPPGRQADAICPQGASEEP